MLAGDGWARDCSRGVVSLVLLLLLLLLCVQSVLGGVTHGKGNRAHSTTLLQNKTTEDAAKPEQVSQDPVQIVAPDKSLEQNDRLHGGKNVQVHSTPDDSQEWGEIYKDKSSYDSKQQGAMSHEGRQDVKRDVREQDEKRWDPGIDAGMMGPPRRLSLAAKLIARLVTLTTGRRPSTKHSMYGRLRQFGRGRKGWGIGRWQGRAPRMRNFHQQNYKSSRHGHGVPQPRRTQQPKMPSLHGLHVPHVQGVQAPDLHGMSLPRSPHIRSKYQPNFRNPQPPRFNNMKVPPTHQMPKLNSRTLPRMYSPGMPNTQVTLNMITRMIREGKIPPINFNCNSNNHILHLVQQHTERDKKKKRRKKRSLGSHYHGSSEESGEQEEEDEEYSDEEYGSDEVEAEKLFPLLKKIEAKDIHALSRQMVHARPYARPIIHHHGPRILLVCISNTYLSTIIKKYRGSGSDESD